MSRRRCSRLRSYHKSTVKITYLVPLGPEGCNDVCQPCFKVQIATAKNINRRILVFRPGVNGQVAFSNDHHSGDAVGTKSMKVAPDDSCLHNLGGGAQDAFCSCWSSDLTDWTLVQLEMYVPAQRLWPGCQDGGVSGFVFDIQRCLPEVEGTASALWHRLQQATITSPSRVASRPILPGSSPAAQAGQAGWGATLLRSAETYLPESKSVGPGHPDSEIGS